MAEMTLQKRDLAKHQWVGLQTESHKILECSACGAELVGLLQTTAKIETFGNEKKPSAQFNTGHASVKGRQFFYKVECCFCGDYSYPADVIGRHLVGPVDGVVITTQTQDGEVTVIHTKKDIA